MSYREAHENLRLLRDNIYTRANFLSHSLERLTAQVLKGGSQNDNRRRRVVSDLTSQRNILQDELNATNTIERILLSLEDEFTKKKKPTKIDFLTVVELLSDDSLREDERERLKELTNNFLLGGLTFTPSTDIEEALLIALNKLR